MCVVDEPELHEGGDQELVYVARHGFRLVFLPQNLINLPRGERKALREISYQILLHRAEKMGSDESKCVKLIITLMPCRFCSALNSDRRLLCSTGEPTGYKA